jgi:protein TonB
MFTTLLESRAPRSRRTGGTTVSALLHGALIAVAVTATSQASGHAAPEPPKEVRIFPIPVRPQPVQPAAQAPSVASPPDHPAYQVPRVDIVITPPTITPTELPQITSGPEIPLDRIGSGGLKSPSNGSSGVASSGVNGIVDVAYVERAPSLLAHPREPRYPAVLRQSGTGGTVVLRFVIDTLGRAEMGELTVVESSHMLFTEAVRAVLPDYRFTPGEVGGRKVRTLVQMPIGFTITR